MIFEGKGKRGRRNWLAALSECQLRQSIACTPSPTPHLAQLNLPTWLSAKPFWLFFPCLCLFVFPPFCSHYDAWSEFPVVNPSSWHGPTYQYPLGRHQNISSFFFRFFCFFLLSLQCQWLIRAAGKARPTTWQTTPLITSSDLPLMFLPISPFSLSTCFLFMAHRLLH